ncbi:dCMP deaminase [Leisingera aquaemixtae]|uniref:deoxycytidylate deaminase n=1 Tax=Leisingera aquaemixtae TaxID=1396826 RepID=UPI001C947941|nr:deaminase [Leisingera aquaemixtae]MBY6066212.1 dCMP deaminase [Leisingera aquaemixtae]
MTISKTDLKFLRLSDEARQQSHDPHRQVGAVIVDDRGTVLSVGANSPPTALQLSSSASFLAITDDPSWKYFMLEHAERNAIYDAQRRGVSLVGATMYCTLFPCADCARAIVASGITRLVAPSGHGASNRDDKWSDHYRFARKILDAAGVILEMVPYQVSAADQSSQVSSQDIGE